VFGFDPGLCFGTLWFLIFIHTSNFSSMVRTGAISICSNYFRELLMNLGTLTSPSALPGSTALVPTGTSAFPGRCLQNNITPGETFN
jgi:hypothetical protein